MWGRHVEHELTEATKGAKNDRQAMGKAQMKMRTLMTDPKAESEDSEVKAPPPPSGAFRDPAARLKS